MSLFSSRLIRYGIPFFVLVIGGSIGLREFTQLRYTYRKQTNFRESLEEAGIKLKDPKEVTLEGEYEKLKNLDINNWENKRIPRPWEE